METTQEQTKSDRHDLLSLTEFANAIGRSYPTAMALMRAGKIEGAFRVGGMVIVPRSAVDKTLEARAANGR